MTWNWKLIRRVAVIGSAVLCVIVLLCAVAFFHLIGTLTARGMRDGRYGVEHIAEHLGQWDATHGSLPAKPNVDEITGNKDHPFKSGHFDMYPYSIEVRGSRPEYAGTTVTYHGQDRQRPIVLTVKHLAHKQWTIHETEIPAWWEVWKR